MNCIYARNPYSGFINEHSQRTCIYEHNPPQPIRWHINIDYWCAFICDYCKDRLLAKHHDADIEKLPPWLLPPWLRPPRPPVLTKPTALLLDDEDLEG